MLVLWSRAELEDKEDICCLTSWRRINHLQWSHSWQRLPKISKRWNRNLPGEDRSYHRRMALWTSCCPPSTVGLCRRIWVRDWVAAQSTWSGPLTFLHHSLSIKKRFLTKRGLRASLCSLSRIQDLVQFQTNSKFSSYQSLLKILSRLTKAFSLRLEVRPSHRPSFLPSTIRLLGLLKLWLWSSSKASYR